MYRFAIDASLAARLLPCVSTEETRYYLNGVCVDFRADAGARLVATNGHILGCFLDRNATGETDGVMAIVHRAALTEGYKAALKASKPYKNTGLPIWLVCEGDTIAKATGRYVMASSAEDALAGDRPGTEEAPGVFAKALWISTESILIDGSFPDYSRVVPTSIDKRAMGSPAFNADYVAAFGKIIEPWATSNSIYGGRGAGVQIVPSDGDRSPFLVMAPHNPDFVGVIMPIVGHGADDLFAHACNVMGRPVPTHATHEAADAAAAVT